MNGSGTFTSNMQLEDSVLMSWCQLYFQYYFVYTNMDFLMLNIYTYHIVLCEYSFYVINRFNFQKKNFNLLLLLEHLHKIMTSSLPWDQSTPHGYFADVLFCIASGECYLIINGTLLILFVSICWHHQAFYERFRHSVLELNYPRNKSNANEILCELIRFHTTVKEYVCCFTTCRLIYF